MEILKSAEVMAPNGIFLLLILGIIIGGFITSIGNDSDNIIVLIVGVIIIGSCIIALFLTPLQVVNPDKMKYTVEITNDAMFKSLVSKGYTIEKVFDNKEIYTIVGDILK